MSGALNGIRVLDLTRVLAGPYCTMILGDLGADVIKVEAPGGSDDTRAWGPPYTGGESAYYLCANRNKRAITLDLKSEDGKNILEKLIQQSDVIIENFKHGTMEKWGLGYEQLNSLNPEIVHCSITGFGHEGPYKDLPGYDFIIQAMSGLMSITGSEESGPTKVGVAISDIFTGLYAAIGIQAALIERNSSGKGQSIDISLFDSQISALANVASNYLVSEKIPKRLGNEHPNIVPYQVFNTLDGQIAVAVGNDGQFVKFMNVVGLTDFSKDEKYATNPKRLENRRELVDLISGQMTKKDTQFWITNLRENGIPSGPINTIAEMFQDPHVKASGIVKEVAHPTAGTISLVGSPLKLSRTPTEVAKHPPLAGEHTEEVLKEIGLSSSAISKLKEKNII